jgi:hypothetical protein
MVVVNLPNVRMTIESDLCPWLCNPEQGAYAELSESHSGEVKLQLMIALHFYVFKFV